MISEDLPLPETPVTQIKFPKGKETSRFFKLFVLTFNSLNILFFFDFLLRLADKMFCPYTANHMLMAPSCA